MRRDQVAEADVLTTLVQPDYITPSEAGRVNAWRLFGNDWLGVTFVEEAGTLVIITVTVRGRRGPAGR